MRPIFCTTFFILANLLALTTSEAYKCPKGWVKFQETICYLLYSSELSYPEAESTCASQSATLASIDSQEEQDFILFNLLGDAQTDVWIGATERPLLNRDFQWADGTSLKFTNWDGGSAASDCVAMDKDLGKWINIDCLKPNYFLCKREAEMTK